MGQQPLILKVVLEDGICPFGRTTMDVARDLRMQTLEPSSKLLEGKFTRYVQLFWIMAKDNMFPLSLNGSLNMSPDRFSHPPLPLHETVQPEWKPMDTRYRVTP